MTRFEIWLRSLLRRAGLIGPASRFAARLKRARGDDGYEERFHDALLGAVREGDEIWDVGANVGFYTELLARRAGDGGTVRAFEPAPHCFEQLRRRTEEKELRNVQLHQVALGAEAGSMQMEIFEDPEQGSHRVIGPGEGGAGATTRVVVVRGDELRAREQLGVPQVVKIDVEGFEEEVIQGMEQTLRDPACRAIFCEVHFAILDSRGRRFAPGAIQDRLREWGFSETRWLDRSHLMAARPDRAPGR